MRACTIFCSARYRLVLRIAIATPLLTMLLHGPAPTQSAIAFADPAFASQWQTGEHIAPNFWGPLDTAQSGQQEPYAKASGSQRLVQYFDKGRMELTNPTTGMVTNGLLATELITGNVQLGDKSFEPRTPPMIPIAGDPDSVGPTYLALHTTASALLAPAQNAIGAPVTKQVSASGTVSSGDAASDSSTTAIAAYDEVTQHNVSAPFVSYRDQVNLLTIGYATSEPFRATVKVAGASREVIVQIFERRVLTYTAANPDPFKVEMGNIGRHYYQWRNASSASALVASPTAPAPTQTAASSATTGPLTVAFAHVTSSVKGGEAAAITVQSTPGASCSGIITGSFRPNISREINLEKRTVGSAGSVTWSAVISLDANPGSWPIAVTCSANGQNVSASSSFTVEADVVPG